MPTVPSYDLPTQELAATQLNTFQSPNAQVGNVNGANINIVDVAGKQASEMGKATLSLGMQMEKIGDEIRDANVKAQDTAVVSKMQDVLYNKESGYLWTKGLDSKDKFEDAKEQFNKSVQDARAQLTDPKEQAAFDRAMGRHYNTFNAAISRHAGEQIRVYSNAESEARQTKYQDMAIANFGTPQFQQYVNTAMAEADARAELNGMGKDARDVLRLKASNQIYGNVVTNLMLNNKYTEAKSVLDDASKKGLITEEAKLTLNRSLIAGYNRESGKNAGDNIYNNRGPAGTDANSIIQWTMNIEGGYVKNDAGKGETNLGINATANPDVDVKNLTPAKAAEIYKTKYWNAIGADNLPPEMRAVAFDAAVNQSVGAAKQMLAEAGNDPQKFIELRRERYQKLIKENPSKFAQYEKSWMNRLDQLEAGIGGESSLGGMLRQADMIEDKEQRDTAKAQIKQLYSEEKAVKEADYKNQFDTAMDIAYKREGGWQDIPAPIWGSLKQADRAKLMERPKGDDPDTVLKLNANPDLWRKGSIEQYRPLLSENTYQRYWTAANGAGGDGKIIEAKIDSEQFEYNLQSAGLDKLIGTPKSKDDKLAKIQLKAKLEDMIYAEQQAKRRALTPAEKNELTRAILKPVKVNATWTGLGAWMGSTTQEKRVFQVQDPRNVIIPADTRARLEKQFKDRGLQATPERLFNAYILSEESE